MSLMTRLNPKTQNITDARGGFGSLTPEDIAHALSGLPKGPYQMGLVYHCGDDPKELIEALYDRVKGDVQKIQGLYIRTLCHMAVAEVCGNNLCPSCQGRAFQFAQVGDKEAIRQPDGLLTKPCKDCNETGKLRMTDQEKADIIGEVLGKPLTEKQYRHRYSWDANKVFMVANGWLSVIDGHIRRHLEEAE